MSKASYSALCSVVCFMQCIRACQEHQKVSALCLPLPSSVFFSSSVSSRQWRHSSYLWLLFVYVAPSSFKWSWICACLKSTWWANISRSNFVISSAPGRFINTFIHQQQPQPIEDRVDEIRQFLDVSVLRWVRSELLSDFENHSEQGVGV